MDSTTAAPDARKPGLLINRNFGLLFAGGAISVFGDIIFDFTLVVWITLGLAHNASWAPLAVSGVLLAAAVPLFIFGPIAGVFVDRWDKRRTMLRMDAIRAVLVGVLVLATNIVPLPFLPDGRLPLAAQLSMIYSIVVINTICAQFFNPAKMALIGDIVPPPQQARAGGLSQTIQMLSLVLAPPIAPILYLATGAQWAIGIDALSFLVSFLLVAAVRAPKAASSVAEGQQPHFLREFMAGLRFSFGNRTISTLIASVAIIMFGASALNALDLFFVLGPLHTTVGLYGFLTAAMGIGAVLGAIFAGIFAQRIGLVRTLNVSLLVVAVAILIYSRLTSFWPAVAVMGVAGIFQSALNVPLGPLLLRITPREMIGRVAATINPVTGLVSMLGTVLAGYLASEVLVNLHANALGMTFGPIDTIFTGSAIIAILGSLYSIARLGFRDPAPRVPPAAPLPVGADAPALTTVGVPETITAA